jgi:hypothetical protein
MTVEADGDNSAFPTGAEAVRGRGRRALLWVLGAILAVVGAVITARNVMQHHHDIGPYLLAGAFLLFLVAALDLSRAQRAKARMATRSVRRLSAHVDLMEDNVQHVWRDRDEWRRLQANEAAVNRRLMEELRGAQRPQISGGTAGVAFAGPSSAVPNARGERYYPPRPPVRRPAPRHLARRPPQNQPPLFDQDAE